MRDEAKVVTLPPGEARPQVANFKAWARLLVRELSARAEVRAYIDEVAERAWDFVVWLQHYTNAEPAHAELALDATGHFISAYANLTLHSEPSARCPSCGSYRLEDGSYLNVDDAEWITVTACAACGWESEPASALV